MLVEMGNGGPQRAFLCNSSIQTGTGSHHEPPKGHRLSQGMPTEWGGLAGALTNEWALPSTVAHNKVGEVTLGGKNECSQDTDTKKCLCGQGQIKGGADILIYPSVFHQNYF